MRRVAILLFFFLSWCLLSATYFLGCSPLLKKGGLSQKKQGKYSNLGTPGVFHHLNLKFRLILLESRIRIGREASFRLTFWKEDEAGVEGPLVDPGMALSIWFWMRMPGGDDHPPSRAGSLLPTRNEQSEVVIGSFDFTDVVFNMSGEWDVHIQLKRTDGTVYDEVQTIWI